MDREREGLRSKPKGGLTNWAVGIVSLREIKMYAVGDGEAQAPSIHLNPGNV